jgi:uncharacterized SAM-binding protein YcdF (DUF218 family)
MDLLDLQRLVTALIMSLPFGLGLAVAGLALLRGPMSRRLGVWLIGVGLMVVGLASLPPVAEALMRSLEHAYPPRGPEDCRPGDAIIVLGGAVQPLLAGDLRPRLHRGSDRVWEAARLYHAGCAPRVVVSAGGLIEAPVRASETDAIAGLLADLGVPRSALVVEATSRNTQGNAVFCRSVLGPLAMDRVLLVTSAWHLRRAVALFEDAGFEVTPVGADYRSIGSCRGIECWVPSVGALEATGLVVKEYLGYWVQVGGGA